MTAPAARHALITGAAIRVGSAIALGLSRNGWDITLHYNTSLDEAEAVAKDIRVTGRTCTLIGANFENASEVAQLIAQNAAAPLTMLIHNASLFEHDTKDPSGTRHKAVNIDAPLALNTAFLAQLPAQTIGTIIHFLDGTPLPPTMSAYAKSRAAMGMMIPTLAERYAPRARVYGLRLGPTLKNPRQSQEHFDGLVAARASKAATTPQAIVQTLLALEAGEARSGSILDL